MSPPNVVKPKSRSQCSRVPGRCEANIAELASLKGKIRGLVCKYYRADDPVRVEWGVKAVMAHLEQNLDSYRGEADLWYWAHRVANNWLLEDLGLSNRRKKTVTTEPLSDQTDLPEYPRVDPPETTVLRRVLPPEIESAVKHLTKEDLVVLRLFFWKDRTLEEIADMLGGSVDAVKKRKERALKKLRVLITTPHPAARKQVTMPGGKGGL